MNQIDRLTELSNAEDAAYVAWRDGDNPDLWRAYEQASDELARVKRELKTNGRRQKAGV